MVREGILVFLSTYVKRLNELFYWCPVTTTGAQIKEAREVAGLSQEETARRLGVSVQTVSRWERGKPIKPRDLAALKSLFASPDGPEADDDTPGLDKIVPRGTGGGRTHWDQIESFIWEVAKMKDSTEDDARFIRRRASSYIELMFRGAKEGTEDEELSSYLDVNLRKQVEIRIKNRRVAAKGRPK